MGVRTVAGCENTFEPISHHVHMPGEGVGRLGP